MRWSTGHDQIDENQICHYRYFNKLSIQQAQDVVHIKKLQQNKMENVLSGLAVDRSPPNKIRYEQKIKTPS
jgi:hypothetical protein